MAVAEYQRLSHGDVRSWSVDDVSKFIAMVPGCSEYAEVGYTAAVVNANEERPEGDSV